MPTLPAAFTERIRRQFDSDADAMLAAMCAVSPASVLVNAAKPVPLPYACREIPWCRWGRLLDDRPSFALDPLWHAGAYYVQESSSMLLSHILHALPVPQHRLAVLDACAAPGGKSLLTASWLGNRGLLVSNEVHAHRNAVLRENVLKWGAGNTVVTRSEVGQMRPLGSCFDVVIADAPCSGEGMFRKDERAAAEWSPAHVTGCARRQQQILSDLIPLVADGGWLIYSTCTYASEENEHNARWLHQQGFAPWVVETPAGWGVDILKESSFFALRCRPHRVPGEGFFISVFRKEMTGSAGSQRAGIRNGIFSECRDILPDGWMNPDAAMLLVKGDPLRYLAPAAPEVLNALARHLYITLAGTPAGEWKGNDWIPHHGLAMRPGALGCKRQLALDEDGARQYLRGQQPDMETPGAGWWLVTFRGIALGWLKSTGNRMNNYYPKAWRLRSA